MEEKDAAGGGGDKKQRRSFSSADSNPTKVGGEISIYVLNAGTMFCGHFVDTSLENLKEMLDVNVYQVGILSRLIVRKLHKRATEGKRSALITLGAISGKEPNPGSVVYCATKAFTIFFTLALGFELKQYNFQRVSPQQRRNKGIALHSQLIDTQCLCPGPTLSNLNRHSQTKYRGWMSEYIKRTLMGFFSVSAEKVVRDSLRDICFQNVNHN